MKLRTGFVSNSSSSSFTCVCCGQTQSGMDVVLSDLETAICDLSFNYSDDDFIMEKEGGY